jgi:D-proline reductase (dithiol) PrdB
VSRSSKQVINRVLQKTFSWSFMHVPWVARFFFRKKAVQCPPVFTELNLPLSRVRLGLVTTGGVHHVDQKPFLGKEESPSGDASFRKLDIGRLQNDFTISHDWYDHSDAEKDLNLVLPFERCFELVEEGVLGALNPTALGLMGHVEGHEEQKLEIQTAHAVAKLFVKEGVDAVLLVPA